MDDTFTTAQTLPPARIVQSARSQTNSHPAVDAREAIVIAEWNRLSETLQFVLSHEALQHAAHFVARQAEVLASEIESGSLADLGGPEALRLLAAVVRINGEGILPSPGHA